MELVRRAISGNEDGATPEEDAILDARMEDFPRHPDAGIPLEQLKVGVRGRLPRR